MDCKLIRRLFGILKENRRFAVGESFRAEILIKIAQAM